MGKISQAQDILKAMGLPAAQQNELSALTLLALCSIKENDDWKDATKKSMRVTKEIMAFVNENYKADSPYAPNTRETFRRQVLHQFVQALQSGADGQLPADSFHYNRQGEGRSFRMRYIFLYRTCHLSEMRALYG